MFPPRRILAPVDFSSYSGTSLAFAARLAQQCGADLHILHIQPPLLAAAAQAQGIDLRGDIRLALAAFVTESLPPGAREPTQQVEAGTASDAICASASKCHADLIVMGPRGRSRVAATLLGSTTKGVLRHAPCPVAVVPATWTPTDRNNGETGTTALVVGIEDVDAPSEALLGASSKLAQALGVGLHVVHAVEATDATDMERRRTALTEYLHAHTLPVKTTVHVERGAASDVLEAYASRAALDRGIVMLGAHGQSGRAGGLVDWHDTALSLMARMPVPFVACRP
jgi:nucleotide-binding universal stress UspA family protein